MVNMKDLPFDFPLELKQIIAKSLWENKTFGYSGTDVFKLTKNQKVMYLKINQINSEFNLEKEKVILEWLDGKLPVPSVIFFDIKNETEFLLISEISGKSAHVFKKDAEKTRNIEILADGLQQIHSVDPKECPFNNNPDKLLQLAELRLKSGGINPKQFDTRWQDEDPLEFFNKALKLKPTRYDFVFSHGDYCLPNVLINNNHLSGFIDWSYGGINDRYFDFAAVAWSIGYNYGEEWIPLFFEKYGLNDVDWDRIKFYQMLNEFFQQ